MSAEKKISYQAFARKRSDGNYELVQSRRVEGKKKPVHHVIMQLGKHADLHDAYAAFYKIFKKTGQAQGSETPAASVVRRDKANAKCKVLWHFLPENRPKMTPPMVFSRADVDQYLKAESNRLLLKTIKQKLDALAAWKKHIAAEFASLRNFTRTTVHNGVPQVAFPSKPIPVDAVQKQNADNEKMVRQLDALLAMPFRSENERLEAIVEAGSVAFTVLASAQKMSDARERRSLKLPKVLQREGTAGQGSDKAPRFSSKKRRSKSAPTPKGPTEYVGRRR